jgi:hypothetical protein
MPFFVFYRHFQVLGETVPSFKFLQVFFGRFVMVNQHHRLVGSARQTKKKKRKEKTTSTSFLPQLWDQTFLPTIVQEKYLLESLDLSLIELDVGVVGEKIHSALEMQLGR